MKLQLSYLKVTLKPGLTQNPNLILVQIKLESFSFIYAKLYLQSVTNIWPKVRKSNKIEQHEKTSICYSG